MFAKRLILGICSLSFILVFMLSQVTPAYAAGPLYVAPGGDDGNSCLSAGSPCATINGAIGKASDGDTIYVATGTYTDAGPEVVLINKSITLSGGWDASFTAQSGQSTIDGQNTRRGLKVNSGVTANLDWFLIQNGSTSSSGGGIDNRGVLTLNNSTVRGNSSNGSSGGGIYNHLFGAIMTLNNSTVSANNAGTYSGGGIYNSFGTMTLNNSTVSNNIAGAGAGIFNGGTLTVNSSTISHNTAISTGGLFQYSGSATLQNSILAENTGGSWPDCAFPPTSAGYNIIGDATSCSFTPTTGDQINLDPKISELIGNPGYHALLSTSPAINAGNPAGCMGSAGLLTTDQRGAARVGNCDIGAYEYTTPGSAASIYAYAGLPQHSPPSTAFWLPLQVMVLDSIGSPVSGVTVTFTAPSSGPSGIFADSSTVSTTAVSDTSGIATAAAFTANGLTGNYTISATASGVTNPAIFSLGNLAWYVATTGNDASDCQTPATACATINTVLGKADFISGDMAFVASGVYIGSGSEVAFINKDARLWGGWDASFTTQDGTSSLDGEGARRGITVDYFVTALIERFTIQNGMSVGNAAGGIWNNGTLTINYSTIKENTAGTDGGGIYNARSLTVNNSSITGNVGSPGGIFNGGTAVINNSTISNNNGDGGSGIKNDLTGILHLNNSTVTQNTSFSSFSGGIRNHGGLVTLQNSIVAGNTEDNGSSASDCSGNIISNGYNLIGNKSSCIFAAATGDLVGTSANPIDPHLSALQDNGGPTFTHTLLSNSPALNAGNPTAPGSGGSACLATDQRGIARPEGNACDIGAYEVNIPLITSIKRLNPNPTIATSVNFLVTFSESVTGIDVEVFSLNTTGITGASISSFNGLGSTYTVTVNTGSGGGNGAIWLDVVDDDSIQDSSGNPLGGIGIGNGNFTTGEIYTLLKVPTLTAPAGTITDPTPTYKWTKIPGATKYQYQLKKGSKIIYTNTVAASACAAMCANTPTTLLSIGSYKWRVRAMLHGVWKDYSVYSPFKVSDVKAGFWNSPGLEFYVIPSGIKVDNFAIYISVSGCGNYKITHTPFIPILNKNFAFGGSFYANGTFTSPKTATGTLGLKLFHIPGCGYLTGGPFYWSAKWKNLSQPAVITLNEGDTPLITIAPEPANSFNLFSIDPDNP